MIRSVLLVLALAAAVPARAGFTVETLAPGVHAFVRAEPVGMMFDANNLLVVGERWALVVDANATAASSREVIAAARRLTVKPVRWLVHTHWHFDHLEGNEAWREAYPDIAIVGHAATREELAGIGAKNRAGMLEAGPRIVEALRARVASGVDRAGHPLGEEAKASLASDADQAARYLEATKTAKFSMPTIEVREKLVLDLGGRTVEVFHPGRGHTRSDLVAWVPDAKVVASGDLVAAPIPLLGNTSWPLDFAGTLDRVLALGAKAWLPGHGPVMRDDAYPMRVRDLAAAIARAAREAASAGATVEEARKRFDAARWREAFAGGSSLRGGLFDMYVLQPAFDAAWRQAAERG